MDDRGRQQASGPSEDARFERIFHRYSAHVQAYCLRRAPLTEARDAAAEVFAIAWRRRTDLPDEPATLPWLYGVARRVLANLRRSRRRRYRLLQRWAGLLDRHQSGPEELTLQRSSDTELVNALQSLSEADQEIIMLIAWEELTREQAAVALGCSEEAAKKRYQRAIGRLEERLATRFWKLDRWPMMERSDR